MNLDEVVTVFQKWLYLPKPEALLAVLGTVAANRLPGDPVWLMVVGPPGGGKSEILGSLAGLEDIRGVGTVTERALLSGTSKKDVDKEAKGGLLRELGAYGIIVCKDFGSLLSMHRDERNRTMAALREVYDGSWTRDVGVDGGRKLFWQGKVGLIAGVTPTIDQHHAVMGAMGERFVMLRLPTADPMALADMALAHAGREAEMRGELQDTVQALFRTLNGTPSVTLSHDEKERLKSLATLVVRCRSAVERDSHSREIDLVPDSEAPTRIVVALDRLLGGLRALGIGDQLAWKIVIQVGLDSMPRLRHDILQTLFMKAGDEMETTEVAEAVRYPRSTTHRSLEDLTAHYVVDRHPHGQGKSDGWTLTRWAHKRLEHAKTDLPRNVGRAKGAPPTVPSLIHPRVPTDKTGEVVEEPISNGNGQVSAEVIAGPWPAEFEGEEPPPMARP